jgi:Rieske Fe-S protein
LSAAVDALQREADLAHDLGFDVEMLRDVPVAHRPGWRIDRQALFHPRKYLRGLLERVPGRGSEVFEGSEVAFDDDHVIRSGPYRITARAVVVATHRPLAGWQSAVNAALRQTELASYTSYVVAARLSRTLDPSPALFWDTSAPYRYVRLDRAAGSVRAIAGGEDHKTGQLEDGRAPFEALERWLVGMLPSARVTHRWSGSVIETPDGLPVIGEVAQGQFAATGFAGNGLTFGTLAAMILSDAIAGSRPNPWARLVDPDRSLIGRGAWNYVRENADYPYYLARDLFAGRSGRPLRALKPGEGALVTVDGKTIAASRDDQGRLSLLSPVCTHLGCRVAWNETEHTWDCPCHGSRFDATGEVLSGPAEHPLRPHGEAPAADATPVRVRDA